MWVVIPIMQVTSYVRWVGSFTSVGLASVSKRKGWAQLFIFH